MPRHGTKERAPPTPPGAAASRVEEAEIKYESDGAPGNSVGVDVRSPVRVPRSGPGVTSEDVWRRAPEWRRTPLVRWQRPGSLRRLVVCAAHPGDATFAAGGFIATAAHFGAQIDVVVLTDGEASHPRSPTFPPAALAERHEYESREAFAILAPGVRPIYLGLPDGQIAEHTGAVVDIIAKVLGSDLADTLVLAPYRRDGWPDHDAAGQAVAKVAADAGVDLWEMPVEMWHWASIADVPWPDMCRFRLARGAFADKVRATACFTSLIDPLSSDPGDEPVFGTEALTHFERNVETFVAPGARLSL